jgi:hypothetical protein
MGSEVARIGLVSTSRGWRDPRRIAAVCVAAIVVVFAPTAARADEPSPMQRETARALMEEGTLRRGQGDLVGALHSFVAADALVRAPTTGYEAGATEAELGHLVEARTRLLEITRAARRPGEPAAFDKARADAVRLSDELYERIPTLRVRIQGLATTDLVDLIVDGSVIPPAAMGAPLRVDPGTHALVLHTTQTAIRRDVTVVERQTAEVVFEPPLGAPGSAPPAPLPPVTALADAPGASAFLIGSLSLAGTGLVVGVTTGIVAWIKSSGLSGACANGNCPRSEAGDLSSTRAFAATADVALAISAVATAVAVVSLLLRPHRESVGHTASTVGLITF